MLNIEENVLFKQCWLHTKFMKTSQVVHKSRQHVRDDVVCAEYKLRLASLAVIHYIGLCL